MAKDSSQPRTVRGGVLRPDATQSLPGKRGTLSRALGAGSLADGCAMVASHERASSLAKSRRLANAPVPPKELQSGTFDDDRRVRVLDPTAFPFSAICELVIYFPNSQPLGGTGFLIGPRLLLTAGHNVFSNGHGVQRIQVYPGLNGNRSDSAFPSVVAEHWMTVDAWSEREDDAFDYGAMLLPTELGNKVGWLSVEKRADGDLPVGLPINTAGYPLDEAPSPQEPPGTTMWWDAGTISRIDSQRIYYSNLRMYNGDSGAPIIVYEPGTDNEYRAIGIHTYLWSQDRDYSATRVNQSMFDIIKDWLRE